MSRLTTSLMAFAVSTVFAAPLMANDATGDSDTGGDSRGWPDQMTAETFSCIRDMTAVRGFYVDNLAGDLEATLAVANSPTGGTYPAGSVVQLVPTEVMVKREAGFSEETRDWEFFELNVAAEGTSIRTRGFADVINRFGGNCLDCHAAAEPQWDMICEQDHGCAPIPLPPVVLRALQKTDPRCEATALSEEEIAALKMLQAAMGGGE